MGKIISGDLLKLCNPNNVYNYTTLCPLFSAF